MRQYCQGVHWKKNVFEWREIKHWNQMQWTTGTNFAIWHTMTNSSSRQRQLQQQNISIATHYTAAGRYIRIDTGTSCSSVQYNNDNRSGPGTLLWNRTRCLRNKKIKVLTTEQQQQRQQHYVCIYNWLLDCSDDTLIIIDYRTYKFLHCNNKNNTY